MTVFESSLLSGTTTRELKHCKERGDYLLCLLKEIPSSNGNS